MDILLSELEECIPSGQNVERQIEEKELGKMISEWLRNIPGRIGIFFAEVF